MDNLTDREPDVTIYTTSSSTGPVLELTAPRIGRPLTVRLKAADIVRDRCARLGREMARVVRGVSTGRGRRLEPERAGRLIEDVAQAGRVFLSYVLRDPREDFANLSGFLRDACPTWRMRGARTPLIHAIADPDHYFPWELLPLFDPFATVEVRDQVELERSSLRFPGFAAVLERADPDHPVNTTHLDGWDRLPVRVVYDSTYPGVQAEVGFFRGNGHLFRLEGPYPRDVEDASEPTLAQQLCDPALRVDGRHGEHPDQVLHVACHCQADGLDTATFAYRLADEQSRHLVVRLDDLLEELMRHWAAAATHPGAGRPPDKPLVFLNACGTAVTDPASAASLLKPFRDNRNRGIIGTAANVPDRIAAEVSRSFYTSLVGRAMNVGEALHEAKWQLLTDRGNPLGLLYAVHAFAGLRIAPVPIPAPIRNLEVLREESDQQPVA